MAKIKYFMIMLVLILNIGLINSAIEIGNIGEEGVNFYGTTALVNYSTINTNNSQYLDGINSSGYWQTDNNQHGLVGNKTGAFYIWTQEKIMAGSLSYVSSNISVFGNNGGSALGIRNNVSGAGGFATGLENNATTSGSSVFGALNHVSGQYAIGSGEYVRVSGNYAHGFGDVLTVSGTNAFCAGTSSTCSGVQSRAIGDSLTSSATSSFAIGQGFTNDVPSSFMVGYTKRQFIVRNGLIDINNSNLNTTGNVSINRSLSFGTEGAVNGSIRNLMYYLDQPYGSAVADGFRVDYNYDFENTFDDWVVFTKTDSNDILADGGFAFTFVNGTNDNATGFKIYGDGRRVESVWNFTAPNICYSNGTGCPMNSSFNQSLTDRMYVPYSSANHSVRISNLTENISLIVDSGSMDFSCLYLLESSLFGFKLCNDGAGNNRFVISNFDSGYEFFEIDRDTGIASFHNFTVFDYNITAPNICYSNGTGCPASSGGNSSWNQSFAEGLFYPYSSNVFNYWNYSTGNVYNYYNSSTSVLTSYNNIAMTNKTTEVFNGNVNITENLRVDNITANGTAFWFNVSSSGYLFDVGGIAHLGRYIDIGPTGGTSRFSQTAFVVAANNDFGFTSSTNNKYTFTSAGKEIFRFGQGSFNITNATYIKGAGGLTLDYLIKLNPITLPACGATTNGTIGRNDTLIYMCDGTCWKGWGSAVCG